jgi:putative membrane protein
VNHALALANASLTTLAIVCMCAGYVAIRRRRVALHRNLMLVAAASGFVFLVLFVKRYVLFGPTAFRRTGFVHAVYYVVTYSHEPLAVINVPLVAVALILGLSGNYTGHREVARIALPVWLYVSVTGVIVYALLYVVQ